MNKHQILETLSKKYEPLSEFYKTDYLPFFVRMANEFQPQNSVLFVGKAENLDKKENHKEIADYLSHALKQAEKWSPSFLKNEEISKPANGAYSRTIERIGGNLKERFFYFARTNLYKLATTKGYAFNSKFVETYLEIFKKEIELLKPSIVVLLTSGLENPFLEYLGKANTVKSEDFPYKNKGNIQKGKIKAVKIENYDCLFVCAYHPQGKPEKKMCKLILKIIYEFQ
jgi:hypothetical protein